MLILTRLDLERAISMKETILVLERAFRELASGTAIIPARQTITIPNSEGWIGIMPAYLGGIGSLATKIVTVFDKNLAKQHPTTMATVVLNDPDTGEALAVIEGTFITAMRTGGLGGLAARYLSREDSRTVGVFGAGAQGRAQLMALKEVRDIVEAYVYDPILERSQSYADRMSRELGIPVHSSQEAAEVAEKSDIIVTASTSRTPVFNGRFLKPGTHINAFGSFRPTDRELDDETVRRSRVVVDLKEAALEEAGDLLVPLKNGIITEDHIVAELSEIIVGSKPGRTSENEITLFKSVGLGIQDCATAWLAYREARKKGIGREVDLST